jgi:glycosyltransferase involved in cell wall biosynthesis
LIEAASRLRERIPNVRILFVGETSPGHDGYLRELEHLARERGVSDIVRFLPFQDWIADVFAALDLHVLLSNDEGFGRVVVEAAAVRIPTIASNVGGIPELIRHGETGYLVGESRAADDNAFREYLDEFVERVVELARNAELRTRMGLAAYEYAKSQFSSERYAEQMMRIFDKAIEEFEASLPPW